VRASVAVAIRDFMRGSWTTAWKEIGVGVGAQFPTSFWRSAE
jgi:hypothetical protein